jgi:hypothetical protein
MVANTCVESTGRFGTETRRVEVERFSLISSKPLQAVLAALGTGVGHPDIAEFAKGDHGYEDLR